VRSLLEITIHGMSRIYSFPPITTPSMRLLILGSMPGEMSLRMQQYYAHPQNAFWKIMGALIGAGREIEYPERVEKLRAHGIGVWDVLESCHRPNSSLDSAITNMQANDFAKLFAQHPALTHVFFNGGKAEEAYRRFVLRSLPEIYGYLRYTRLPSTSPAHAGMPYIEKLNRWKQLLEPLDN
jgi:TDG/mug DNA glycosylase family protein